MTTGLDVEAVLRMHLGDGSDDCAECCACATVDEYVAHVAAVLRVEIGEWLTNDQTYREVAARSILNQGAADTACRSLADQLNPYRPTLAADEGES